MTDQVLINNLEIALQDVPMICIHAHLDPKQLTAQGLHHVLLYHMPLSELYSAGMPNGDRLSWYASKEEARSRIEEALPYLKHVKNTSLQWGIKRILADLYDWNEPITEDNWQAIDSVIAEKSEGPSWPREIMKRCNVVSSSTEFRLRDEGQADDILTYALEWAFFTRAQQNMNDSPLFELEWTWSQDAPSAPLPVNVDKSKFVPEKTITTLDDVQDAMQHYIATVPFDKLVCAANHFSTDINYFDVTEDDMRHALENRDHATEHDRDIYTGYILQEYLNALETQSKKVVFTFSVGAEPMEHETASLLPQKTLGQLMNVYAKHPDLQFVCFSSSAFSEQSLCTLVRELPNFSLAGYWWHNFFPKIIDDIIDTRLDMLPMNKQIGFFSDAYHLDWLYGKTFFVRKCMANVLARKIERGQYTFDESIDIAKQICYDTPKTIFKL
ncbi:MAG TPA: hypothetical protein VKM55_07210 [Candidatus Lokiarchaeia archaeon]|nr:hypothetical protein [Candidatus Lokiarchaeia archaeon]